MRREPMNKTNARCTHARTKHKEAHSLERVWYVTSSEPSDACPPDRSYLAFAPNPVLHALYYTTLLVVSTAVLLVLI